MFQVTGVEQLRASLRQMGLRIQAATPRVVETGAHLLEGKTKANLSRTSHQRGTPTPSRPGEPPALISGRLRSSVTSTVPARAGDMWVSRIGPTTVYSRIQELGGLAGRNHASRLPARPYLKPAAMALAHDAAFRQAVAEIWGRAIR